MRMTIASLLAAISVIGMTAFSVGAFEGEAASDDQPDLAPAT